MRFSCPYKIEKYLKREGILESLHKKAIKLILLDRAVKAELPQFFHAWCRVANLRKNILIVETANANWMTRLRYEQSVLLSILRKKTLPSLRAINFVINPSLVMIDYPIKYRYITPISNKTAILLRKVAERSPQNVKNALEKLADLANKK
ncbi:MAG: DciA family protein [Candidatus Dasytiphilus stammeri]